MKTRETREDQLRYIKENQAEMERLANEAHEEMRWIWDNSNYLVAGIFAIGFAAGKLL